MNIGKLEQCFENAKATNAKFMGVKIQMQGFEEPEIIINPRENFDAKLEYYKKSYNEDLTLKSFNGIKIVGWSIGNDFAEIEAFLIHQEY